MGDAEVDLKNGANGSETEAGANYEEITELEVQQNGAEQTHRTLENKSRTDGVTEKSTSKGNTSKIQWLLGNPHTSPRNKNEFDISFLKTTEGLLTLIEMLLSLFCYICAVASHRSSHATWTEYTSWTAMMITFGLLLKNVVFSHALHDLQFGTKKALNLSLAIWYCVTALFYLISGILMAVLAAYPSPWNASGPKTAAILSCIGCFLLTFVFGLHTILGIKLRNDTIVPDHKPVTKIPTPDIV